MKVKQERTLSNKEKRKSLHTGRDKRNKSVNIEDNKWMIYKWNKIY